MGNRRSLATKSSTRSVALMMTSFSGVQLPFAESARRSGTTREIRPATQSTVSELQRYACTGNPQLYLKDAVKVFVVSKVL